MNTWERKDKRIGRLAIFKSIYEKIGKFGKEEKELAENVEKWVIEDSFDEEKREKTFEEKVESGEIKTKDEAIKELKDEQGNETPFE